MAGSKKNKLFDVARPGKTPASPSARPLVVSNRPMLKDPMMADDKREAKEVTEKDNDNDKTLPASPAKTVPVPPEANNRDNEDKNESSDPKEAKEQETSTKQTDETGDSVTESAPADDKQSRAPQQAQANQQEEQIKAELINKLITEKKYFVPIGEVTRRRANRKALIILAVLILAGAAIYLLIDAGIIKTSFKLPLDLIPNR